MNSVLPPEVSSLNEISEQWLAEQWLVKAGVFPDSAIDTLLMYAYVQTGVNHKGVTLEIDRDEVGEGKSPSVTYKIKLEPSALFKWKAVKKAESIGNPIIKKAALLALAKAGAPYGIVDQIKNLAKEYLPKHYKIEVQIV